MPFAFPSSQIFEDAVSLSTSVSKFILSFWCAFLRRVVNLFGVVAGAFTCVGVVYGPVSA